MTDLTKIPSAKNITEDWGERCSDFEPECPCCQMWAMHDAIDSISSENAALKAERDRRSVTLPSWWRATSGLAEAISRYQRIKADLKEFDGDRRGIASALGKAERDILLHLPDDEDGPYRNSDLVAACAELVVRSALSTGQEEGR